MLTTQSPFSAAKCGEAPIRNVGQRDLHHDFDVFPAKSQFVLIPDFDAKKKTRLQVLNAWFRFAARLKARGYVVKMIIPTVAEGEEWKIDDQLMAQSSETREEWWQALYKTMIDAPLEKVPLGKADRTEVVEEVVRVMEGHYRRYGETTYEWQQTKYVRMGEEEWEAEAGKHVLELRYTDIESRISSIVSGVNREIILGTHKPGQEKIPFWTCSDNIDARCGDDTDAQNYIPLENGILHVRTGTILEHTHSNTQTADAAILSPGGCSFTVHDCAGMRSLQFHSRSGQRALFPRRSTFEQKPDCSQLLGGVKLGVSFRLRLST